MNTADLQRRPEHPLAQKLFRQFRAGSAILTKTDAYNIGNELESLLAYNKEMEAKIESAVSAANQLEGMIAEMRRKAEAALESLSKLP